MRTSGLGRVADLVLRYYYPHYISIYQLHISIYPVIPFIHSICMVLAMYPAIHDLIIYPSIDTCSIHLYKWSNDFNFYLSILLFKRYFLSRSSQCIIFTDPNDQGSFVADENGSNEPLRKYSQKTLVIVLPGDLTVFDIGEQYLVVQMRMVCNYCTKVIVLTENLVGAFQRFRTYHYLEQISKPLADYAWSRQEK